MTYLEHVQHRIANGYRAKSAALLLDVYHGLAQLGYVVQCTVLKAGVPACSQSIVLIRANGTVSFQ